MGTAQPWEREQLLLRRIKALTGLFILGLLFSGATAIPLPSELDRLMEGLENTA